VHSNWTSILLLVSKWSLFKKPLEASLCHTTLAMKDCFICIISALICIWICSKSWHSNHETFMPNLWSVIGDDGVLMENQKEIKSDGWKQPHCDVICRVLFTLLRSQTLLRFSPYHNYQTAWNFAAHHPRQQYASLNSCLCLFHLPQPHLDILLSFSMVPVKNWLVPLFGTMYLLVPLCASTGLTVHPLVWVIHINRNVSWRWF
jgi:hypothetical protein